MPDISSPDNAGAAAMTTGMLPSVCHASHKPIHHTSYTSGSHHPRLSVLPSCRLLTFAHGISLSLVYAKLPALSSAFEDFFKISAICTWSSTTFLSIRTNSIAFSRNRRYICCIFTSSPVCCLPAFSALPSAAKSLSGSESPSTLPRRSPHYPPQPSPDRPPRRLSQHSISP